MSRLGGEVEGEVKDGMWDVEAKYRGGLVTNHQTFAECRHVLM